MVELVDDAADMRVPLADVDRVAIGRRLGETAHAQTAACAADILDDDWLAEDRFHPLGHDPRGGVGRTARREWNDQRDLT
jgi:hypothetical protein